MAGTENPESEQWTRLFEESAPSDEARDRAPILRRAPPVSGHFVRAHTASLDAVAGRDGSPPRSTPPPELRSTGAWLDGMPLPAALVTATGEISGVSQAFAELDPTLRNLVGRSLPDLMIPEDQERVAGLIAFPLGRSGSAPSELATLARTGETFAIGVGNPLGGGHRALRIVTLVPQALRENQPTLPPPSLSPQSGWRPSSVPPAAPGAAPTDPLRALEGLPLPALVVCDNRIVTITARAASLLGVPVSKLEQQEVAALLGSGAEAQLGPAQHRRRSVWKPKALAAIPVRVDGSVRAAACCFIPFGRAGVGLLLLEPWGEAGAATQGDTAKHSSSGYLLAGIAHEINNPLAFVIPTLAELHAELSRQRNRLRAFAVDDWLEQVEEIRQGVDRIAGVVRNLRGAQERATTLEPTDVNHVVAETLRLATPSLALGIQLHRDLGMVGPASAHRQQLGQILLNLVINAAHAIADSEQGGGNIFVRTWQCQDSVWLEVQDDGPGVPEQYRQRVFEPFFTTRQNGSGLGLAVCRALAREHGGDLVLLPPGESGAVFRLQLPRWKAVSQNCTGADEPEPCGTRDTPSLRVLLVDDERAVRRALGRQLRRRHRVVEASSVEEALEKAAQQEFDVLVTDLVMSHGGGAALIERLRARGSPLADRVVVVSGMAPDSVRLPCLRVTKPCTETELFAAVAAAVDMSPLSAMRPLDGNLNQAPQAPSNGA